MALSSTEIQLILNAVDNVSGTLSTVKGAADKLSTGLAGAKDFAAGLGINLSALSNPTMAAGQAVKVLYDYVVGSGDAMVAYAEQVRDLGRATGMGAEETSRLIQVADDLKVDFGTLKLAARTLAREGMVPNVETMAKLADQYVAIRDPQERAAWATKNLGRNYQELSKILEVGGDKLREMAAAQSEALILTEKDLQITRQLEIAMDERNDSLEALKLTIGEKVVPAQLALFNVTNDLFKQDWKQWLGTGQLDLIKMLYNELRGVNEIMTATTTSTNTYVATRGDMEAALSTGAKYAHDYEGGLDGARRAISDVDVVITKTGIIKDFETLNVEYWEASEAAKAAALAELELQAAIKNEQDVYSEAIDALGRFNIGLGTRIELEERLKLLSGELTEEDILRKDAIGFLTKMLETGKITEEDYITMMQNLALDAGYARDVILGLAGAVNGLPSDKTVTIHVEVEGDLPPSAGEGGIGPEGPPQAPVPDTDTGAPSPSDPNAPRFSGGGSGGEGTTVINQYISDPVTAAFAANEIQRIRYGRASSLMGA